MSQLSFYIGYFGYFLGGFRVFLDRFRSFQLVSHLVSTEKDMDIAIEKGGMMSGKAARETIAQANEKLKSAAP